MTFARGRAGAALLVAVLALGCSRGGKPATRTVAARVVSLSPSTTEAMFAIGAGGALVGRSRYCDYPPAAAALPQVGGFVEPNLEAILALRPDLVVGARGPGGKKYVEALEARGIATFFPETESFAAVDGMIGALGDRTGHATEAAGEVGRIDARVAAIAAAVAALPKSRTLLVFGTAPIVAAGPGGFPDEMIARAGGVNVVTEGAAYPTLGVERVIALDPDVVLDAALGEARVTPDAPGWRDVGAVKKGRVVVIADEAVLRPGPRIADGLATVARALHAGASIP